MIIFETERLVVRQYEENDRGNFLCLNEDEEVMRYIRPVRTREETNKFFEENLAIYSNTPSLGRWAVFEKPAGNFAGSFAIIPIPGQPELIQLGYALLKSHWGKGYATELTVAGLKHAFQVMDLPEIYGLTEKENVNSQKVLLKSGFEKTGEKPENEKTVCWFLCKREVNLKSAI
jgi:ribosomal-protein-alanine N-acetyltransferase